MIVFTWLILPQREIESIVLLDRIFDFLNEIGLLESEYLLDGRKRSLGAISKMIESKAPSYFWLVGENGSVSLSSDGSHNLDTFSVEVPARIAVEHKDPLAKCILELEGVFYGFAADKQYLGWQNQRDPSAYDNLEGLTIVPREESPWDKEIVDISRNPGRYALHPGMFEGVGGLMWLTPEFFELAETSREILDDIPDLGIEEASGLVKLTLDSEFLVNGAETPALVRLQNRVRSALFSKFNTNT